MGVAEVLCLSAVWDDGERPTARPLPASKPGGLAHAVFLSIPTFIASPGEARDASRHARQRRAPAAGFEPCAAELSSTLAKASSTGSATHAS